MKTKVIIIGGGPGGVFSAVYLNRFKIDCVLFEKNDIGGLIKYADSIENFPFLKPISGEEFVSKLKNVLYENKIKTIFQEVRKINFKKRFIVQTDKIEYLSDYLILATGTQPVIIKELENIKNDVLDFWNNFFKIKNKKVAIIGGGDAAFDNALKLSKRGNKVILLSRGIRSIKLLVDRCVKNKKIKIISIEKIIGANKEKNGYDIIYKKNNEIQRVKVDCVICSCGRVPHYGGITNIDKIIINKYFKDKFFLCGDIKNERFRQIINSVSDAMKIAMRIKELEYEGKS